MPIYEYSCHKCDYEFELMRPISQSSAAATCPKCKHDADRKLSTFASFSVSSGGSVTPVAGTGSTCATCGGTHCSTCAG